MKACLVRYLLLPALFQLLLPCLLAQEPHAPAAQSPAPAATGQQAPASQSSQPPSDSSAQQQNSQAAKSDSNGDIRKQEQTGTSDDRLFFALPNFLTVETPNVPPLTVGQKFKVVARGSFDPIQIPWYATLAGISQAENSESGFGQGAEGYGKRYGAYAADGTIENFFVGAIFPSVLHQDPRYYQLGRGGFGHRVGYAVSRIFVTRSDSGDRQINYSEIVGAGAASAISTYSYHPQGDRTAGNTCSVWGSQVGYDTITLVIKEFWPDIRRRLKRKQAPVH